MTKRHVLHAEPGRFQLIGMEATGRVIANFAWQHLKAATTFRDHLVRLEAEHGGRPFGSFFEEIRSYGSACIMSATASLEALINELFIAHNSRLRALLVDFEAKFWGKRGIERRPILEKYQLALEMLGQPRLDERTPPYLDAWALIELRNALMHYKPTWDPDRRRHVELKDVLSGRFPLSPFPDAGADFVSMKCMSAGCAKWVIATATGLIREFDSRTNLDERKMASFRGVGTVAGARRPGRILARRLPRKRSWPGPRRWS
jgi:hypothetical protein